MNDGYIKISRKSLSNPMYFSEPFSKWHAWCDLIMLARYKDSEFIIRGIKVEAKRGCVYISSQDLAERWKWSRGKVLRFLNGLEMEQQIVQQKSNVITCISICNYDSYQVCGTTDSTTNGTTDEEKKKVAKKNKKERKQDNISPYNPPKGYEDFDFSFIDDSFKPVIFGWLQYKLDRKDKKYVEQGLKALYTKLLNLSNNDVETAKRIVEQSYANNWAGIFELKRNNNGTTQTNQGPCQGSDHPTDEQLERNGGGLIAGLAEKRRNGETAFRK